MEPTRHLECCECGQNATSPVPANTMVRAYILCPECLEQIPDDIANAFFFHAGKRRLMLLLESTQED